MKHSIRCNQCQEVTSVNGQRQISAFSGQHNHGSEHARITGCNIELDKPQDRIDLKIDPKPLITGLPYRSNVRDFVKDDTAIRGIKINNIK